MALSDSCGWTRQRHRTVSPRAQRDRRSATRQHGIATAQLVI